MFKVYYRGKPASDTLPLTKFNAESVGVFESVRTYGRKVFQLDQHIKRFYESVKSVGLEKPPAEEDLKKWVLETVEVFDEDDIFIRFTLWNDEVYFLVGTRKHDEGAFRRGVKIKTSSTTQSAPKAFDLQSKTTAYQQALMATLVPDPGKPYEWLFLNQEGNVSETRVGNIFMVKKQGGFPMIITPPKYLVLDGVTRQFVLKCALAAGYMVDETLFTRTELYNADEVFLSNTSWEILPVREVDGRKIARGKPGEITQQLQKVFKEEVEKSFWG